MLILPDYGHPYLISSLTAPIIIKYHWIFNAQLCDFVLSPITYLEETTGAAVKIRVNNSEFWVPASWNILVTETETYQLDTVSIQSCASVKHMAYAFSTEEMKLRTLDVMVLDVCENMSLVHPMIAKATGLVLPVGPLSTLANGKTVNLSIVAGPHDLYKHIGKKVVGDLMSW
jgi:hypothetical protein